MYLFYFLLFGWRQSTFYAQLWWFNSQRTGIIRHRFENVIFMLQHLCELCITKISLNIVVGKSFSKPLMQLIYHLIYIYIYVHQMHTFWSILFCTRHLRNFVSETSACIHTTTPQSKKYVCLNSKLTEWSLLFESKRNMLCYHQYLIVVELSMGHLKQQHNILCSETQNQQTKWPQLVCVDLRDCIVNICSPIRKAKMYDAYCSHLSCGSTSTQTIRVYSVKYLLKIAAIVGLIMMFVCEGHFSKNNMIIVLQNIPWHADHLFCQHNSAD